MNTALPAGMSPVEATPEDYVELYSMGMEPATDSIVLHLESNDDLSIDDFRDSGIVITRKTADKLDKSVGDSLTIFNQAAVDSSIGASQIELEIVAIDSHPFIDAYLPWQTLYSMDNPLSTDPLPTGLREILISVLPIGEFELEFPIITVFMGLTGMLVITTIASLYPSLSAARKSVSDILRYQ